MDPAALATLVETGRQILADKLFMISMHCLWVYDYFLTFGDEITYAWVGMGSWVFALFLAVRYIPVFYLVWVNITMFHYTVPVCGATKWGTLFITVIVTALAQIAVSLRVYAITERNKLFGGALSAMIITQLSFGTYLIVENARGSAKPLPQMDLDAYKLCLSAQWPIGGFILTGLGIAFDVLAFAIIVARARRPAMRFQGIPNLLDIILRDATVYFALMFTCQVCFLISLFFAPRVKFTPGVANTIFTPIMATRLILSLKKASAEPTGLWSLQIMSTLNKGESTEDTIVHIPSQTPSVNHPTSNRASPGKS